ncbi:MAG: NlpC/P60 family protein [Spirochaetia bacterium]|nr:NlpC/P60 family protein [Spirochaetia bacterium]
MYKKLIICFLTLILCSEIILANKKDNEESHAQLREIIENACSSENIDIYYNQALKIVKKLRDKEDWIKSVKAVVYPSCFLEYRSWLFKISFNLGYYGIKNNLKIETVESLTNMLSIQTYGKNDYLKLGQLFEKIKSMGVKSYDIDNLFSEAIIEGYTPEAIKGLAIIYISNRQKNIEHMKALKDAMSLSEPFKKNRYDAFIEKSAFEIINPISEEVENPEINKKSAESENTFWENSENSINNHTEHTYVPEKEWDKNKLNDFITKWLGAPYKYGGFSTKGIDGSGFVLKAIYDQFSDALLPRSAYKLSNMGKPREFEELTTGDILFFNASEKKGKITHVGLYLENGEFVHASTKRGVTKSNLLDPYYKNRYQKAIYLFD